MVNMKKKLPIRVIVLGERRLLVNKVVVIVVWLSSGFILRINLEIMRSRWEEWEDRIMKSALEIGCECLWECSFVAERHGVLRGSQVQNDLPLCSILRWHNHREVYPRNVAVRTGKQIYNIRPQIKVLSRWLF